MAYPELEFSQSALLASLLITQGPILLGLTLLETAARDGKGRLQSILGRNLLVWCVAALAFGLLGFPIMYPGEGRPDFLAHWRELFGEAALPGFKGFADPEAMIFAELLFQCSFCTLATLLAAAALPAKRGHWLALLFAFVFGAVIYPCYGRWSWGQGWLGNLGFHDFAGGTLIYGPGGIATLAMGFLFRRSSNIVQPAGSASRASAWILGIAFLWFLPSAFALLSRIGGPEGASWSYPPVQFAVDISALAGGLGALFLSLARDRRLDLPRASVGLLAGMATAAAGADIVPVQTLGIVACAVGALSGLVSQSLARARLPDPVAAIAGFGLGGIAGTIVTGFYTGHPGVQWAGVVANALWTALTVALFLGFLLRPARSPGP